MGKNNYYLLLIILCFFCGGSLSAFGQDILIRTNNDSLKGKIISIGPDKIKFKKTGNPNYPVMDIYKNQVKEIIFENGNHMTVIYDMYQVPNDMIIKPRTHVVKFDYLSPIWNHYTIGYEWNIATATSMEFKGGFIGTQVSRALKHSEGGFFKAGIKFIYLTESFQKGIKYVRPMQGAYFKPELIFSKYTTNEENGKVNYTNAAVNIIFGKQYILGDIIAFDFFGGIGYGYQYSSYHAKSIYDQKSVDFSYAYSHIFMGKNLPLAISGGLLIGFVY